MDLPNSLSEIFSIDNFRNYPLVEIPQEFSDDRGIIRNIADGQLGDVAIIHSKANSIRANHFHDKDWHLSYMVYGAMKYLWADDEKSSNSKLITVEEGQMVYTPAKVPHKMQFLSDSCFIAVSALSRAQDNYEEDTQRLSPDFFIAR